MVDRTNEADGTTAGIGLPQRSTRTGAPGCLTRLAGLTAAVALGWYAADAALEALVSHQYELISALRGRGMAHEQGPELLALGEPSSPLQVVVACDLSHTDCRNVLRWLLNWRAEWPDRDLLPGDEPPRLVFLQRAAEGQEAQEVAAGLRALDLQAHFWDVAADLASQPQRPLTVGSVRAALAAVDGHLPRWDRERQEAETALRVRIDRTMAQGLEIPLETGLLVNGQPLAPAELASEAALKAALHKAATHLASRLGQTRGVVGGAQLDLLAGRPERVRERYVRWILKGERMPAL